MFGINTLFCTSDITRAQAWHSQNKHCMSGLSFSKWVTVHKFPIVHTYGVAGPWLTFRKRRWAFLPTNDHNIYPGTRTALKRLSRNVDSTTTDCIITHVTLRKCFRVYLPEYQNNADVHVVLKKLISEICGAYTKPQQGCVMHMYASHAYTCNCTVYMKTLLPSNTQVHIAMTSSWEQSCTILEVHKQGHVQYNAKSCTFE